MIFKKKKRKRKLTIFFQKHLQYFRQKSSIFQFSLSKIKIKNFNLNIYYLN